MSLRKAASVHFSTTSFTILVALWFVSDTPNTCYSNFILHHNCIVGLLKIINVLHHRVMENGLFVSFHPKTFDVIPSDSRTWPRNVGSRLKRNWTFLLFCFAARKPNHLIGDFRFSFFSLNDFLVLSDQLDRFHFSGKHSNKFPQKDLLGFAEIL